MTDNAWATDDELPEPPKTDPIPEDEFPAPPDDYTPPEESE